MNISFFPSLEAIDFQKGSPLAIELTNAFQEVIDHREKFTVASDRIRESVKFFNEVTCDKIKAITKKYTGMNMKRVVSSEKWDFAFATRMFFGDEFNVNASTFIESYCGNAAYAEYLRYLMKDEGWRVTTYEDMMRVTNSLNLTSGYINNLKFSNGYKVSIELLFDPYGAFCIKELHHKCVDYFTARELAGIVAHELGHTISMIEMAKFSYFAMKTIKLALAEFDKNASPSDKKKLLIAMNEQLTDEQKQAINDIEYKPDDKVSNFFVILWSLFKSVKLIFLPIRVMWHVVRCMFTDNKRINAQNIYGEYNNSKNDYTYSEKNLVYCEQLADQYAVRQGLGSALVTGLQKFDEWFSVSGLGKGSKTSSAVWAAKRIPCFISTLFDSGVSLDEHEQHRERFASILREQLQIFKQSNLSKEALNFYISDYENTIKAIKNAPKQESLENTVKAFYAVIEYLASTPRHMLTSARFQQEYNKLVENVEKLMNNSLYYRKAKLESLIK